MHPINKVNHFSGCSFSVYTIAYLAMGFKGGFKQIGDNCNFGPDVTIVTPVHPMLPDERRVMLTAEGEKRHLCYAKPVHIGNDCWFGASVTVCPGVTIGNNCVIGAGSVVTRDIPANSFAAGNPCRVIREITEADSMKYKPEVLADNHVVSEEYHK